MVITKNLRQKSGLQLRPMISIKPKLTEIDKWHTRKDVFRYPENNSIYHLSCVKLFKPHLKNRITVLNRRSSTSMLFPEINNQNSLTILPTIDLNFSYEIDLFNNQNINQRIKNQININQKPKNFN